MQFSSLDLSSAILDAVRDEGYDTPTPIQTKAIPPALEGRDVLGCAQTGTGKTAAFALPIIQHLDEGAPPSRGRNGRGRAGRRARRLPRALVLSPTRELATQIGDAFATYGRNTPLTHTVIFGGVSQARQERALLQGPDVIVATPGRLIDLMDQGLIDLSEIDHLVLDEADRMLDMGFIQPIRKIAGALPTERQTLLFSATMPREIMKLADSLLTDPVKVAVTPVASAAPLIEQSVYMVTKAHKQSLLEHVLTESDVRRALVFTRTKHGADKVVRKLAKAGIAADAIHGNKSQRQRERALNALRSGRARVLVATDVAARGIDVDAISHVFNYDIPVEPESYVHRIGRTGRAGATGLAIAFCDPEERDSLRAIEKLTGQKVPVVDRPESLVVTARRSGGRNGAPGTPAPGRATPAEAGRAGRGDNASASRKGARRPDERGRRARVRKDAVPAHPSGPARAGTTARTDPDGTGQGGTGRGGSGRGGTGLQTRANGAAATPKPKPSYTRGPHSQRTRRPRRK